MGFRALGGSAAGQVLGQLVSPVVPTLLRAHSPVVHARHPRRISDARASFLPKRDKATAAVGQEIETDQIYSQNDMQRERETAAKREKKREKENDLRFVHVGFRRKGKQI